MAKTIFITGGARSGKSQIAEKLTLQFGSPLGYLATGRASDKEMASRITRHQARRGTAWQTIEEPLDLVKVLVGHDGYFKAILIDCVTLWLTNLLMEYDDASRVLSEVRTLTATFANLQTPLIMVSNEVGMGIIPENHLARVFCDLAGESNELLAQTADDVYVTFSGIPLKLKG